MDERRARELLAAARVARLATVTPEGRPHVVPVTFVLDGDVAYHAVDHKPKRTRALQRLRNLEADPRAALLADRYDEDWERLWWVRADGAAEILDDAPHALDLLQAKYEQYADRRPGGPVVALRIERVTGWRAAGAR